jgi:hypothetical protein
MSSQKAERTLCGSSLRNTDLTRWYHLPRPLQAFAVGKANTRRCVACDSRVTNRSLGGNDGRSALTGPIWCLDCADYARQLVLNFGSIG